MYTCVVITLKHMYYTSRYEKLNRKIDLWEEKKRDKARRKLDKSEVDYMICLFL